MSEKGGLENRLPVSKSVAQMSNSFDRHIWGRIMGRMGPRAEVYVRLGSYLPYGQKRVTFDDIDMVYKQS